MSTLGATVLTLADWAKRLDPDGKVAKIVELLGQTNEILDDMMWMEGNLPVGHRVSVRTGLPTVAWRLLNQGVSGSKSTTAQIDEQCGMLEAWSEVDKDLAELNGNVAAFRLSEARAFIEAMNQEMASTLFYGNAGLAPEEITGLSIRYSSTTANNGQNTVLGGSSDTDNSSIWLVVWGENSIFGIFPKGSKAGLIHEDLGLQTVQTSTSVGGSRMRAYQDHWQWKPGIALKDWRYVVRAPNIDISLLVAKTSAADLFDIMIKMINRVPNIALGRPVFYVNRTVKQMLEIQTRDDVTAGGGLTFDNVSGKRVSSFQGIPVKICDALLQNETLVS